MPVNKACPEHEAMLPKWQRCRDCFEGSDAVKARGQAYLPPLDSHAATAGGAALYAAYLARALFYNATRRTVQGLGGAVFQKSMSVECPPAVKPDLQDVTLSGQSLEAFAQELTGEELTVGSYGILIEMPAEATATRPYWVRYRAEQVINWASTRINGVQTLSLVVLREAEAVAKDEYCAEAVEQYRVLRLVEGKYTQAVYRKAKERDEWQLVPGSDVVPLRRGVPLPFIPFVWDAELDAPPLLDLVDVNLSHYCNSADLEHGLHHVGVPQLVVTGWQAPPPSADGSKPQDDQVRFGSGNALLLGVGGDAKIIQADGELLGALERADERKRKLMATLGARLLEDQGGSAETATAVSMRHSGEHATLASLVQELERDLTLALQWHAWWSGNDATPEATGCKVELNKQFFANLASPAEISSALELLQDGRISYATFYDRLQRGGWARDGVTLEQEREEIAKEKAANAEAEQEKANAAARLALAASLKREPPPPPPVDEPDPEMEDAAA